MPVRSLSSPVLKWPDAKSVIRSLRRVKKVTQIRPDVVQIGYYGSYARGDWGVGSDLDLVIILQRSEKPFEMRAIEFDTLELPVPTDVLVYTQEEWDSLRRQKRPFTKTEQDMVWVHHRKKDL